MLPQQSAYNHGYGGQQVFCPNIKWEIFVMRTYRACVDECPHIQVYARYNASLDCFQYVISNHIVLRLYPCPSYVHAQTVFIPNDIVLMGPLESKSGWVR